MLYHYFYLIIEIINYLFNFTENIICNITLMTKTNSNMSYIDLHYNSKISPYLNVEAQLFKNCCV